MTAITPGDQIRHDLVALTELNRAALPPASTGPVCRPTQAVRGIDFYVPASDHRPVEVEVEVEPCPPRGRAVMNITSALTGAGPCPRGTSGQGRWAELTESPDPGKPPGASEVSRITSGNRPASALCGCTCIIQAP